MKNCSAVYLSAVERHRINTLISLVRDVLIQCESEELHEVNAFFLP